jgi:hypothetical protein
MARELAPNNDRTVRATQAPEPIQRKKGRHQHGAEPGTPAHWAGVLNNSPRAQSLRQLQRGLTARTAGVVQRLAYDDTPYPNLAPRAPQLTVNKSGAGQTGVYLAAENGQLAVVVKFLGQQEAFRAALADKSMAAGTGLETPQSRVIPSGTPGNAQIKRDLAGHATPQRPDDRLKREVANDTSDQQTSVLLMSPVAHVSLQDLAVGREGQRKDDEHARLLDLLRDPQIARDFAKIIVSDALLGNSDRFLKGALSSNKTRRFGDVPVNTSNIFVSGDLRRGVALDNDVSRANQKAVDEAFDESRTYWIRYVAQPTIGGDIAGAVVKSCLLDAGEITQETWDADYTRFNTPLASIIKPGEQALARNLATAIAEEITQIRKTLRSKKKTLRQDYYDIATSSGYALASPKKFTGTEASKVIDYNQLRARAKLLKALSKDREDETGAEKAARKHLKHKREKEAKKKS